MAGEPRYLGEEFPVPPSVIVTAVPVFTAGGRTYPSCKTPLSEELGKALGGGRGGIVKGQVKVKST